MEIVKKVPISVLIPTRNEEANIAKCLDSVEWADEIFVVDSNSNDETVSIAKEFCAKIYQHKWEGYSDQKNWALDELPISNEWVLFLDADECVSSELAVEIREVIEKSDQLVGYYVNRRMIFLGRWLKHAWWYPDRHLRLFKHRLGRFDNRAVHERVVLNGSVGYLKGDLIHEDRRDLYCFLERHNRYSTLESLERYNEKTGKIKPDITPSFFGDWTQRRRALKNVWIRIPLRPLVRFLWIYLVRLGFLDGKQGLIFASLISTYEFHINAKYFELIQKTKDGQA